MSNADERLMQKAVDEKYRTHLKNPMVAINSNLMAVKNEYVAIQAMMDVEDKAMLDVNATTFIANIRARADELEAAIGVV